MPKIHLRNGIQELSPLTSAVLIIVGAIVLGIFLVLGFFAFLALGTAALATAGVIAIRRWWAQRMGGDQVVHDESRQGEFIEGEFHVVNKDKNS